MLLHAAAGPSSAWSVADGITGHQLDESATSAVNLRLIQHRYYCGTGARKVTVHLSISVAPPLAVPVSVPATSLFRLTVAGRFIKRRSPAMRTYRVVAVSLLNAPVHHPYAVCTFTYEVNPVPEQNPSWVVTSPFADVRLITFHTSQNVQTASPCACALRTRVHYNLLQLIWALQTSTTELPASSLIKLSPAKFLGAWFNPTVGS